MKIELWYDYIYTKTRVRVNDLWQEESDMYAFLYPVRNYPLQTWLYPAGSWTGLAQQLRDLARGEEMELVFYGRTLDAQDLLEAVKGVEHLTINHREWDVFTLYDNKMEELKKNFLDLKKLLKVEESLEQKVTDWRNQKPREETWLLSITSKEALQYAEKDNRPCCMVDGDFLESLEALHAAERLTRALHRPLDAICCCFSDKERREAFEAYAREFPRLQFLFAEAGGQDFKETLWKKYGQAAWTACQMQEGAQLCEEIVEYLDRQKVLYDKQKMGLIHKKTEKGLNHKEEEELTICQETISKIYSARRAWQKQKSSMEAQGADLELGELHGKDKNNGGTSAGINAVSG